MHSKNRNDKVLGSLTQKFFGLVLCLLAPTLAHGATYYVSKAGRDTNTCAQAKSQTTSKQSINAGISCISSGDTLIIGDGLYAERIANTVPSGTSGAPTTIKAENRNGAILRPSGGFYVVEITQPRSYITFDGLDADGVNALQAIYYLSADSGTVSNIRIINGRARNSQEDGGYGGAGIECGAHANVSGHHHIEVSGMDISGSENDSGDGSGGYGIYIKCRDSLFENNNLHDNDGYSVHQYTSSGSGIDNNIVRNNTMSGAGIETGQSTSSVANILISGGSGNLYYNNTIYGGPGHGIFVYASAATTGVYNNTIYGNSGTCVLLSAAAGISNTTIRNDICYGNGSNSISNGGSGTTSSNNLLGTNPLFVNAGAADFHLQVGSPAIGAGVNLSGIFAVDSSGIARSSSSSWDLGAYASGGSATSGGSTQPVAPTNLRLAGQ